jgi:hypothetical protein
LRGEDLYSNHRIAGVKPSEVKGGAEFNTRNKQAATKAAGKTMKPIASDHFTDSQGNVYRREGKKTQEYQKGKWTNVTTSGNSAKPNDNVVSREHAPATSGRPETGKPIATDRQPSTAPTRDHQGRKPNIQQRDPQRIQQERSRGDQRVKEYRGYQQMQRSAPPVQRPAPSTRPTPPSSPRQPAPSKSEGGRSGGRR